MPSRPYLAVAVIVLVAGAGWGAYELRKRAPVAPASTTTTRVPAEEARRDDAPAAPGVRPPTREAVTILEADDSGEPSAVAKPPPDPGDITAATTPSSGAAIEQWAGVEAEPAPVGAARDSGVDAKDEPPAPTSETLKRVLSEMFGGGVDAPVPERTPAEPTPVTPPPPPASAGSDYGAVAEIEPGAAPSFDIVRIGPDGAAVIAGRAAPEAEVELRSGERVIDRVRANRRGEWVAVPPEPLPEGDQELSIAARVGDGLAVESDEVLVVAVPEPPPPQPAPRVAAAPPPPQPPPLVGAEPQMATVAARSPSGPLAVALPKAGGGQGRVLQAPGRISTDGQLALMVLDYDDTGRIRLRGEAAPGVPLRVYVDNQPAGAVMVEPSGQWSKVLEAALAPGDYTLRLDQLDPSGKPTARLETPFTRVSQPPVEGDVQVDFVIVQPGNSLWRIARRLFGEGMHYVHIYDANQGQIRDPDLIYPGQVFEIPSGLGAAG